ncbi:MAG: SLBB domain-containing protein [Candidatus Riflebacteria bacterium]|nr:SLBB domain-containing protein [Candidatus Riflebacteria bacterium]
MTNSITSGAEKTRVWLVVGLTLAAVALIPHQLSALGLSENKSALPFSDDALVCEVPVNEGAEIYGLRQMAEAVHGYRRGKASNKETGRQISFIIAGEVGSPGEYELRSPVNLLAAVLSAGGPSEDGSMRRVEVYQAGSLLGEFDLYSFLTEGRIADDFVFNGGEQIVVLPHGPRISVTGGVARSALFELKPEEMRLDRALALAGMPEDAGVYRVEVVRVDGSKRYTVYSFDYQRGRAIVPYRLESGDQIHVLKCEKLLQARVYAQLPGQLRQALGYRLDLRITDLLRELDPLPGNVSLSYAEILREGRPDKKYEVISISIDVLLRQIAAGDFSNDLIIRPGDLLMLFDREFLEKKPVVGLEIKGQPLVFVNFKPGMKIWDLLKEGRVKLSRKRTKSTVYRRQLNGSQLDVVSLGVDVGAAQRKNERHNIELQPFDTLQIQP